MDESGLSDTANWVKYHSLGVIGAAEVWHLFADASTAGTIGPMIALLTPELVTYFHDRTADAMKNESDPQRRFAEHVAWHLPNEPRQSE